MIRRSTLTTRDVRLHRAVVYGLAALSILFAHTITKIPSGAVFAPLRWLRYNGVGVEIFTLLSGFGLYHSLEKNSGDIAGFYRRRLSRIVPPTFIVTVICYGLVDWISISEYLLSLLILPYWFGAPVMWYVAFILTMYLIYPLIYLLQKKSPHTVWLLTALSVVFFALCCYVWIPGNSHYLMPIVRTPLFLFGCAIAPWANRGEAIPGWVAPVSLAAYIAIALLPDGTTAPFFRGTSYHFLSIFLVIALTRLSQLLAQCNFLRWIYDALVFCGDVSLEIYLIYTRLLYFMAKLPVYKSGGIGHLKLECVTILLTFILAPLLRKSCYIRSRKQIN